MEKNICIKHRIIWKLPELKLNFFSRRQVTRISIPPFDFTSFIHQWQIANLYRIEWAEYTQYVVLCMHINRNRLIRSHIWTQIQSTILTADGGSCNISHRYSCNAIERPQELKTRLLHRDPKSNVMDIFMFDCNYFIEKRDIQNYFGESSFIGISWLSHLVSIQFFVSLCWKFHRNRKQKKYVNITIVILCIHALLWVPQCGRKNEDFHRSFCCSLLWRFVLAWAGATMKVVIFTLSPTLYAMVDQPKQLDTQNSSNCILHFI